MELTKRLKIVIVGRGNAGCVTALHYAYYTRKFSNVDIELIYDPETPTEKVGQASLVTLPYLLWLAIKISWYKNQTNSTNKFGVVYENWGKKNKYIYHGFNFAATGLHYDPKSLQDVILNSGLFKVSHQKVDSIANIDADYIFDCRGKRINDYSEYNILDNPLNSVIVCQKQGRDINQAWTRAVATPDGWTFVIPNTTNTTSIGYLYNNEITSYEEAHKNYSNMFQINQPTDSFTFKNYVAKNPIQGNVILNGNRLFFLEPLESTAIQGYLDWARYTFDYIFSGAKKEETVSKFKNYLYQVKNFINMHYLYGSTYDTPFWNKAPSLITKDNSFQKLLEDVKKIPMIDLIDPLLYNNKEHMYGQINFWNLKIWLEGVEKNDNI